MVDVALTTSDLNTIIGALAFTHCSDAALRSRLETARRQAQTPQRSLPNAMPKATLDMTGAVLGSAVSATKVEPPFVEALEPPRLILTAENCEDLIALLKFGTITNRDRLQRLGSLFETYQGMLKPKRVNAYETMGHANIAGVIKNLPYRWDGKRTTSYGFHAWIEREGRTHRLLATSMANGNPENLIWEWTL